jgi:hypothetical protein
VDQALSSILVSLDPREVQEMDARLVDPWGREAGRKGEGQEGEVRAGKTEKKGEELKIEVRQGEGGREEVVIGEVHVPRRIPRVPALIPKTLFFPVPRHVRRLQDMLKDFALGEHLLLIGNQGIPLLLPPSSPSSSRSSPFLSFHSFPLPTPSSSLPPSPSSPFTPFPFLHPPPSPSFLLPPPSPLPPPSLFCTLTMV